jgi:hypothetical protein
VVTVEEEAVEKPSNWVSKAGGALAVSLSESDTNGFEFNFIANADSDTTGPGPGPAITELAHCAEEDVTQDSGEDGDEIGEYVVKEVSDVGVGVGLLMLLLLETRLLLLLLLLPL